MNRILYIQLQISTQCHTNGLHPYFNHVQRNYSQSSSSFTDPLLWFYPTPFNITTCLRPLLSLGVFFFFVKHNKVISIQAPFFQCGLDFSEVSEKKKKKCFVCLWTLWLELYVESLTIRRWEIICQWYRLNKMYTNPIGREKKKIHFFVIFKAQKMIPSTESEIKAKEGGLPSCLFLLPDSIEHATMKSSTNGSNRFGCFH